MSGVACPAAHRMRAAIISNRDAAMRAARTFRSLGMIESAADMVRSARYAQHQALRLARQGR